MEADKSDLFERMPISRAVISLVIPTVISQIITVIYNMADTFFIGQMNDPNQVAAATLIMPPFVMMTGIANLFGIGGASLISRSLGAGDFARARRCAVYSIYTSALFALIYGLAIYFSGQVLFPLLGSDAATYAYCKSYALWTIAIGAVPTVLSACLAHLVRAEGYSKEAAFGVALGGILNMLLDPLFIFAFDLGIAGAAIATMLSNVCACLYFARLIYKNRKNTAITLSLKYYSWGNGVPREVLLVGFPAFMMLLTGTFSNIVLNKMVVSYSNEAIAGMGIAKKIDMLAFAIANGMTQGVLPLIGYNYAAKNHRRMRAAIRTSFLYAFIVATAGALYLFLGAVPVMKFFINDAATVSYGQHFLRVICVTCPAISITMMIITIFQATGQKVKPMILSFARKGGFDVPLMFALNASLGVQGIPYATPISDILAMLCAFVFFVPCWRKIKAEEAKALCEALNTNE